MESGHNVGRCGQHGVGGVKDKGGIEILLSYDGTELTVRVNGL